MPWSPLSLAVVLIAAIILISKLAAVSKAAWIIIMVIAIVLALVDWGYYHRRVA